MSRVLGTVVRGLRAPIIKAGDALNDIVVDTLLHASEVADFSIQDKDILAITESILARSQGNVVSVDQVADSFKKTFNSNRIGVLFPILSRNRFLPILKAVARASKEVVIQLQLPADEQGNHLISDAQLAASGINPMQTVLSEREFRHLFGTSIHPFTGEDYIDLYRQVVETEGATCQLIFSNQPQAILNYAKDILIANVHGRQPVRDQLLNTANQAFTLQEICTSESNQHGYNPEFGLLGANLATAESLKLFPRDSQVFVESVQEKIKTKTGKLIEVMIYGDGAFKDPVGHIWELADPVVSPGYTKGLEGTPDEIKLKYIADSHFSHLSGDALKQAMSAYIQNRTDTQDVKNRLGTTPRQITDLVGSLADLTSGSGDKGTPFIYVQGYFDSYAD